ncbi:hypothetical protein MAUB_15790 [Mycolicibacterium aubagnense]|uniref:DUF4129 domain-containing protein n=1 Tax=Mycolicibacterium aubagnense TaxID=319707 RepID=A0ABM7IB17_9MYCO|nr:hypothetical protein MAUB_15790 [Mycolicibacterium aubagnense]
MNGIDKALGRVVALIALLFFVVVALRGHLPGSDHPHPGKPATTAASQVGIDTLLIVSVIIVAIAFVASLRRPRTASASAPFPLPGSFDGKLTWKLVRRLLLICVGALLTWLVILVLFSHLQLLQLPDLPFSEPPQNSAPMTGVSPPPPSTTSPPIAPRQREPSVFGYLLAATVAMLLLWAVGGVMVRRSRRAAELQLPVADRQEPLVGESTPETLTRAAEFGLAEIGDRSRGPRESIIACYAAMERALSPMLPAPRRRSPTRPLKCWPGPSNTMLCTPAARPNSSPCSPRHASARTS